MVAVLTLLLVASAACKLSRHELNTVRRDAEELERLFATYMVCTDDDAYNRSNALLRDMVERLWDCTLS